MSCAEIALTVLMYHNMRKSQIPPLKSQVVATAPVEHHPLIDIAYSLPRSFYRGKLLVFIEQDCIKAMKTGGYHD